MRPVFELVLELVFKLKELPPTSFKSADLRVDISRLTPSLTQEQHALLQQLFGFLFNEDPFQKSIRLLLALTKVDNDSPEADDIRDKLDEPERQLTDGQRKLWGELSAALPHK